MKIVIVDASEIVVERVRNLLSNIEGLEFIGHATTASYAVEAILNRNLIWWLRGGSSIRLSSAMSQVVRSQRREVYHKKGSKKVKYGR